MVDAVYSIKANTVFKKLQNVQILKDSILRKTMIYVRPKKEAYYYQDTLQNSCYLSTLLLPA